MHFSEELKTLIALNLQDAVQKGEAASHSRPKNGPLTTLSSEQGDNDFSAHNKKQISSRSSSLERNPRGNPEGNAQETIKDRK